MNKKEVTAIGRSLAYALHDSFDSDTTAGSVLGELNDTVINILVSEFWNAMDRNLIHRSYVKPATAITRAYLLWYRKKGHQLDLPTPEWNVEYR